MHYRIEQFGPSRCMFESNFPVEKVSYSYHVLYNACKRVSQGDSAAERAALFHDTAAPVYRIRIQGPDDGDAHGSAAARPRRLPGHSSAAGYNAAETCGPH